MSKLMSCMSVLIVALGAVTVPQQAVARSTPARLGASAFFRDGSCWDPWGAQMTNKNCTSRYWTVPLLIDGPVTGTVTVAALAPDVSHNVSCRAESTDRNNNDVFVSEWVALSQFSAPHDIVLPVSIPAGGMVIIDCLVAQTATVISVNW